MGLIINLCLCLLLGLACYGTSINQGDYWFLGLFPLGTPFFLAGVLAFLLIWLFVKKIYLLPGLLTLILCYKPIAHIIPFRYTPGFSKEKDDKTLRVMSWNVEHFNITRYREQPDVKQRMIDLVNEYQPDIACFQEMVAGDSARGRINYTAEFTKKLKMKYYYYSYNPIFDFDFLHHFGIIIFSKFPIIRKQTLECKPYTYNSTYQYVDILKGSDTLRIMNIHLQSLRFTPENKRYIQDPTQTGADDIKESKSILAKFRTSLIRRHRQADQVRKTMDQSPYPIILCGDFNDVPNSYSYRIVGKNMNNAFAEAGYGIGTTYSQIMPTLRIDNIFFDPKLEVKQFTRISKKMSDHYPIVADFISRK